MRWCNGPAFFALGGQTMRHFKEILILVVCIIALGITGYKLIGIWLMYQEGVTEYEELKKYVNETPEEDGENGNESEGNENSDAATTIDFEELQKINPDIVAWIRIEGLGIDYPVVQGEDNEHYLHYTFRGEANVAGSIFLDYRNKADFSDSKIILYGHNMKNGTMFGFLKKYQDESVFQENQIITIYLPGNREWKFKVQECRNVKVNDSCYELEDDRSGEVEFWDKELLLSTCGSFADQRLVVFGKLQR